MIHEHALQLAGFERTACQHARYGRIHATGDAADHQAVAHLRTNAGKHLLDLILGLIDLAATAHATHEVFQHLRAFHGMAHLGMELHAVQPARRAGKFCIGAGGRIREGFKAFRQLRYAIVVVHENVRIAADVCKQRALARMQQRISVFRHICALHFAAVEIVNQLHAVTNAEYRHAQAVNHFAGHARRVRLIHARRAACQNHAAQTGVAPLFHRRTVGQNFTVNAHFAHAPSYQLVILAAKVEYDNFLAVQALPPPFSLRMYSTL